jgi:hypothetical protein
MPEQMMPASPRAKKARNGSTATSVQYDSDRSVPLAGRTSDLEVASIREIVPAPDGAVIVIRAEALLGDRRTDLEIAITTDLAPTMAIALLATTAKARAGRDDLDPALDCLAADASVLSGQDKLRLRLLFDKGAVLPVEMTLEAGVHLSQRLERMLGRGAGPQG